MCSAEKDGAIKRGKGSSLCGAKADYCGTERAVSKGGTGTAVAPWISRSAGWHAVETARAETCSSSCKKGRMKHSLIGSKCRSLGMS